jgi:squalene-hopene/tetraprenyl-beta-curcumene cyclase
MNPMVDPDRLLAAYTTARCDLLAETSSAGTWVGRLSSSPLATASAISALAIVERHAPTAGGRLLDERRECVLSELIVGSLRWLAQHQNSDGGWGDTDSGPSTLAATMLVRAAFALTFTPASDPGMLDRADAFIAARGGVKGLKQQYGKTLAAPILAHYALAGLVDWKHVPSLPLELALVPPSLWQQRNVAAGSYWLPAVVAVSQARRFHRPGKLPLVNRLRSPALSESLATVERLQPASGGFLECTPLTGLVVMSLASSGLAGHPIVRRGIEFLLSTVRPDGSWPIARNLAMWNTTLAVNALHAAGEDPSELHCISWILDYQQRLPEESGGTRGGWSWSDAPGSMPNSDDTAGALLALHAAFESGHRDRARILPAVAAGMAWLLELQNSDGGWPMFARGRSQLPFFASAPDLSAHALRALHVWRRELARAESDGEIDRFDWDRRLTRAIEAGLRYLATAQQCDGSWIPLRFGSHHHPQGANPIYGTSRVLVAFSELEVLDNPVARRGLDWLTAQRRPDGGFSSAATAPATLEETSLAVEALVLCGQSPAHEEAAERGLQWITSAIEANRHHEPSPIGLYFGKLRYSDRQYPLVMTTAVSRSSRPVYHRLPACRHLGPKSSASATLIAPMRDRGTSAGDKSAVYTPRRPNAAA